MIDWKEERRQARKQELESYLDSGLDYGTAFKKVYGRSPSNFLVEVRWYGEVIGEYELSSRTINKLEADYTALKCLEVDHCPKSKHKYSDVIKGVEEFSKRCKGIE